jgi:DNA-binding NarL/FixJ family response regulator
LEPDVVLLAGLPDLNGFELAARLTRTYPALAVQMISGGCDYNFYERAPLGGADGFVAKSELAIIDLSCQ